MTDDSITLQAGNMVGDAVLAAADRGVKVTIHKDKIAAVYEYTGGNKQSFFHKRVDPIRGVQAWFLGAVNRNKGSFRQRPNALAEAILSHRNITANVRQVSPCIRSERSRACATASSAWRQVTWTT